MKHIKLFEDFINEANNESVYPSNDFVNEAEGYNGVGTLTVATLSQKNLFECEISGQISDGAWESSKPSDHWKPWASSKVAVGSDVGRDFPVKKDGYNLSSLIQYIGGRMLVYGAAGAAGIELDGKNKGVFEYFFNYYDGTGYKWHTIKDALEIERLCSTEDFETYFEKAVKKMEGIEDYHWNEYVDHYKRDKADLKKTWDTIESGRYKLGNLKKDLIEISKSMKIKK